VLFTVTGIVINTIGFFGSEARMETSCLDTPKLSNIAHDHIVQLRAEVIEAHNTCKKCKAQ